MKVFFLGLIFITLIFSNIKGQDRIWCFGDSAGIDFSNLSTPMPISTFMDSPYSCASLSDSSGLIAYAHSCYWPLWIQGYERTTVVRNRYNNIMQNGDSLVGNGFYNGFSFVRIPNSDSLYYLFQRGYFQDAGLYYSIVNPYFNNGNGRVIVKNIQLPLTSDSMGYGFSIVKHGNGRDWWLITRISWSSNSFNLFLVAADSITGPFIQNIGIITQTNTTMLSVSKNGDKIVLSSYNDEIEVYDFDRCTGIVSNPVPITFSPIFPVCNSEFSPSGQLLYVSSTDNIFGDSLRLYQFDLSNSNPSSTVQVIFKDKVPASGGNLRRAIDDKIYLSCLYQTGWPYADTVRNIYNENLSVINSPDVYGPGCNFQAFSFYLGGKRTYWSLPNNPNDKLGAMIGSSCDSLSLNVSSVAPVNTFSIYPNPVSNNTVTVSYSVKNQSDVLLIYNCNGVEVARYILNGNNHFQRIDFSELSKGIYFVRLLSDPESGTKVINE